MRIGNMTSALGVRPETGEAIGPCEAVRRCAAAGFEVMDINLCGLHRGPGPFRGEGWRKAAEEVRNEAERCNVRFVQSHMPYRSLSMKPDMELFSSPEGAEKYRELSLRAIEITHILGASWAVIHPMDDPDAPLGDLDAQIRYNLRILDREMELCAKLNVGFAFENIFDQPKRRRFGIKAMELLALIEACHSPLVGACWDVGHGNLTMDHQDSAIMRLGPHIKALHIHDNNGKDDLHMLPFTGTVQWESVMHALYASGCQADLIFETGFSRMPDSLKDDGLRACMSIGRHLVSLYQ